MNVLYKSGDAFLPQPIVEFLSTYIVGNDQTIYYINLWSIMHFLAGVCIRMFTSLDIYTALALHTFWEIWQIWIGMTVTNTRGLVDIANDTLFFTLGYFL